MQAMAIADRVSELLQDVDNVTWTQEQIIEWINDAQRFVISIRPEACVKTTIESLTVAESRQTLPANATRLIMITSLFNADGVTRQPPIREIKRRYLEDFNTGIFGNTGTVKEYFYDPEDPLAYYVFPSPNAAQKIELIYNAVPTAITDLADNIDVDDHHSPAMIEWCLYRALSRDSENTPSMAKASAYRQNANALLGNIVTTENVDSEGTRSFDR